MNTSNNSTHNLKETSLMSFNKYDINGNLLIGGIPAKNLAEKYGTPVYVYDEMIINQEILNWKYVLAAYPKTSLCYAVKANGNLNILKYFWNAGISFDIVSDGELARLRKIGVSGSRIVFSGVGKSHAEIEAAITAKVRCFNIESVDEIARLSEIARAHQVKIPVAIRVNPDIDAKTHPYISTGLTDNKFGMSIEECIAAFEKYRGDEFLDWQGLACHIGSNMFDPAPYHQAAQALIEIALKLKRQGINISHLDCGGGIGVAYKPTDKPAKVGDFVTPIFAMVEKSGLDVELIFEPGRRLIAEAGTLITKVEYIKTNNRKKFIIVDAAMTELMRPSLYQAWHNITPLVKKSSTSDNNDSVSLVDVVGPVCESSDFLGKGRQLSAEVGDYLAINTVGAYGFAMSSNYNARPRPPEVFIDNGKDILIRKRESVEDLYRDEVI